MQAIDTLIRARWIVPVEPDVRPLEGHALAVNDGRILSVEPAESALRRYAPAALIDRPAHVLLPGLVDARACPSAAAGSDRTPASDPASARTATDRGIASLLRSGTTCYADDSPRPDVAARAAAQWRVRVCVGLPVQDADSGWASGIDEHVERGMQLRDEYRGDPLLTTRFAAPCIDALDDKVWQRLRRLVDELEIGIALPLHASAAEVERSVAAHDARPLARLERLGLVSPLLTALHLTQAHDADLELLAESGASVVHTPTGDLRHGRGVAALPRWLGRGIRTALGSDLGIDADHDLLGEARLAWLLAAGVTAAPSIVTAADLLRLATLDGARVLGLGEQTGSLVAGKWADLCCVKLEHADALPATELLSQLVGGGRSRAVSDTWVAGRALLSEGRLQGAGT